MINAEMIALEAEAIIGGYAVLPCNENYKVVNLNTGYGVAVFTEDGTLIETNMDPIELSIAKGVLTRSLDYLVA